MHAKDALRFKPSYVFDIVFKVGVDRCLHIIWESCTYTHEKYSSCHLLPFNNLIKFYTMRFKN
jgi:hypothetical protein